MKKIIVFAVTLIFFSLFTEAQEVKWHSFEEADALLKKNPKPVFIDAYTDWCGWCKRLDSDTFSNPVIAKYLNDNFIPVKFNAESKEPVTFLGKKFVNDGRYGRTHELALALMSGKASYPTVIFLNENGELLAPVPGYRGPAEFEPLLVFFAEKKYLNTKWDDFLENFQGSIKSENLTK